jgi:putative hydrolase of the HAD superfamily
VYQAVFFDAGNTLFHTPVEREERIARALARRGLAVDRERLHEAMERARNETWDSFQGYPRSRQEEDEWELAYFQRLLELLEQDANLAPELIRETWFTHYLEAFPDVRPVLEALRGRVRLGVISNAWPSLDEALQVLNLHAFFDVVINSSLVDAWKPEERIFQIALEEMGVSSESSVFVDDLPQNVEAAENLGFTAFLIDRQDQYPDLDHRRITNLWPVARLIEESSD